MKRYLAVAVAVSIHTGWNDKTASAIDKAPPIENDTKKKSHATGQTDIYI